MGATKQPRHYACEEVASSFLLAMTIFFILGLMKNHQYAIYIMTNKSNTVLYVGVTSDLYDRVSKHKHKVYEGFTSKYHCDKLVYFEEYQWIHDAIAREKRAVRGKRKSI